MQILMGLAEEPIEIGGRTYTLTAGTNMMRALESRFSSPHHALTAGEIIKLADGGSATHFTGFVWAMLRKHHGELTMDQVGDLIDRAGGAVAFQPAIQKLITQLVPELADLQKLGVSPNPPAAQPVAKPRRRRKVGTGENSAPWPASQG